MNTYVLGAGASLHAGYPLMACLGAQLFTWMKQQPDSIQGYSATTEILEEVFGPVQNFETLLTQIGKLIKNFEHGTPEQRETRTVVANSRGRLCRALREWFSEIRRHDADAYSLFARHIVQPGDCIISFNYDVSLDRELHLAEKWSVGDGYGFRIGGVAEGSIVKLLKLHGSANWLAVLFGGMTSGSFALGAGGALGARPAIPKNELEFLGYTGVADPLFPDRTGAIEVMIMPGEAKEFYFDTNLGIEFKEFWDSLWGQAAEALSKTKRLVIAGYSLPGVDERARELLLNSVPKDSVIEVASGNQSNCIAKEFQANGYAGAAPAKKTYFEQWVVERKTARSCEVS